MLNSMAFCPFTQKLPAVALPGKATVLDVAPISVVPARICRCEGRDWTGIILNTACSISQEFEKLTLRITRRSGLSDAVAADGPER
jgi:hypothetical protein